MRSDWKTRCCIVGICFLVGSGTAARPLAAQDRGQPNDGLEGVVFSCDFEADDWYRRWDEPEEPPRTALVAEDPQRGFESRDGKALRIRIDEGGHYGASLTYRFQQQTGSEPEEICLRYDLRLADDWNPTGGGKFPGIAGTYGKAGWGGRPAGGRDGWSARGLFERRRDGKTPIGFYCYHAEMRGRYGSHWVWDEDAASLENNRWYSIQQFVKLNTPGQNDGILRGWVDDKLAFEKTDVRFRDVESLRIETVWMNVYFGGIGAAKRTHHLYIDNVVIAREPSAGHPGRALDGK